LLIIHNQQFFSLPAWLPKRPILGRKGLGHKMARGTFWDILIKSCS
jgi:hypothetical protein